MPPPVATSCGKRGAKSPLPIIDCSKKISIVCSHSSFGSFLKEYSSLPVSCGPPKKDTNKKDTEVAHNFNFNDVAPSLNDSNKKPSHVTLELRNNTASSPSTLDEAKTAKINICVPSCEVLTDSHPGVSIKEYDTSSSCETKPEIPCYSIRADKKIISIFVKDENKNYLDWLCQDEICMNLELKNNKFYQKQNPGEVKKGVIQTEELGVEKVASMFMHPIRKIEPSHLSFERPVHYIRFNNATKKPKHYVFGKMLTTYCFAIEDFVFLLNLICYQAKLLSRTLTIPFIRLLLSQCLTKRNIPSNSNTALKRPCYTSSPFVHSTVVTKNANGSHEASAPCSFESKDTHPVHVSQKSSVFSYALKRPKPFWQFIKSKPYALSNMDDSLLMSYKKLMGPYITDEVFLYLINLFETLTDTHEPISLEIAVSETHQHLGLLTPTTSVLRETYFYWISRRAATGKPLLREYWPIPSGSDNNSFTVFRTRAKEKMLLRRPRRSNIDFTYQLKKFDLQLGILESFFVECSVLHSIKLKLFYLDACLFQQICKQRKNPAYINPLWRKMCQELQNECGSINVPCHFHAVKCNTNTSEISNSGTTRMDAGSKKRKVDSLLKKGETQSKTLEDNYSDKESEVQFLKRRRICSTTKNFNAKAQFPLAQPIISCMECNTSDCYSSDESPYFPSKLITKHFLPKKRYKPSTPLSTKSNVALNRSSSPEHSSQSSFTLNNENSVNQSSREFLCTLGSDYIQSDRQVESDMCCFVSPIPLPPVYLNLPFPSCSSVLQEALRSVWVSSEDASSPPIGYIKNSLSDQTRFNFLSPMNVFSNVAQDRQSKKMCASYPIPELRATNSIQSLSFNEQKFSCHKPTSETTFAESDGFLPIYRQSLMCLPPHVRHEKNRRLVIPYSPDNCLDTSECCNGSKFELGRPYLDSSTMRVTMRIGRGGRRRPWLDRHRYVLPNLSNLAPRSLPLTCSQSQAAFPIVCDSTELFMQQYLQSHTRRLISAYKFISANHTIASESVQTLQCIVNNIGKDTTSNVAIKKNYNVYDMQDCSTILPLLLKFSESHQVNIARDIQPKGRKNTNISVTPQETLYPIVLDSCNKSISLNFTFYNALSPQSKTLLDSAYTIICGVHNSGFYPTGFGGNECSLTGTMRSDTEPPFTGILGVDGVSSSGGFHLFSIPRHRVLTLSRCHCFPGNISSLEHSNISSTTNIGGRRNSVISGTSRNHPSDKHNNSVSQHQKK
ncbi:uncharacterized protein LOC128884353 isoform X2 [Hylaeus volcanicus]|uniref:uncharacterized protein LOC128884353 isoform X2 n=1 Tax=Hylaeus volcanicus TaxID=313075 RepID=UPI0023B7C321|nr:uncharacterized protein LOC128884353 isoform X2 [Hylaeus volcanicus]